MCLVVNTSRSVCDSSPLRASIPRRDKAARKCNGGMKEVPPLGYQKPHADDVAHSSQGMATSPASLRASRVLQKIRIRFQAASSASQENDFINPKTLFWGPARPPKAFWGTHHGKVQRRFSASPKAQSPPTKPKIQRNFVALSAGVIFLSNHEKKQRCHAFTET